MTCCGPLIDITTHDNFEAMFLCSECGKQGPEDAFPDPAPEPAMTPTWREKIAVALYRLADRITQ